VAHPSPPVPPLIVVGSGTVMIHGMPAARWAPAPDFSACGTVLGDPKLVIGRTVFIGGPSSLTVSIANLDALLQAKLDAINEWDAPARADFKKWFGRTDESSRQIVIRRIGKMQNLLKGYRDSNFRGAGTQNADGLFAFVDPADDTVVSVGNAWATAPLTGTDSQAGALGHEMSHFRSVGGTDDHVYGANPSKDLANSSPDRALDNADNFEYYLEDAP